MQRLKNAFPFFGDDMVQTGGIGEFIARAPANRRFLDAARKVARAGWRAEVHSLGRAQRDEPAAGFELRSRPTRP